MTTAKIVARSSEYPIQKTVLLLPAYSIKIIDPKTNQYKEQDSRSDEYPNTANKTPDPVTTTNRTLDPMATRIQRTCLQIQWRLYVYRRQDTRSDDYPGATNRTPDTMNMRIQQIRLQIKWLPRYSEVDYGHDNYSSAAKRTPIQLNTRVQWNRTTDPMTTRVQYRPTEPMTTRIQQFFPDLMTTWVQQTRLHIRRLHVYTKQDSRSNYYLSTSNRTPDLMTIRVQ